VRLFARLTWLITIMPRTHLYTASLLSLDVWLESLLAGEWQVVELVACFARSSLRRSRLGTGAWIFRLCEPPVLCQSLYHQLLNSSSRSELVPRPDQFLCEEEVFLRSGDDDFDLK
jgi:hypothetical protein